MLRASHCDEIYCGLLRMWHIKFKQGNQKKKCQWNINSDATMYIKTKITLEAAAACETFLLYW